jgi:hypothetical protein
MVAAVVTGVFQELVGGPPGKAYFDGTTPCESRDFINGAILQKGLVRSLTAYFGQAQLLGCSQSSFPTYRGIRDMELLHKNMPIGKDLYAAFIAAFAKVVKGALGETEVKDTLDAGISSLVLLIVLRLTRFYLTDLAAVAGLLNSDAEYTVICNQDDCAGTKGTYEEKVCDEPTTPGVTTPAPGGSPSGSTAPSPTSAAAPLFISALVVLAALFAL